MRFELFGITPDTGQWRWKEERTYRAVENYKRLISYIVDSGIDEDQIDDHIIDEYYHQYLQEESILDFSDFELVRLGSTGKPEHYIPSSTEVLLSENWTDISVAGRQTEFSHEKNEEILRRILDWVTKKGDIVLDFNLGSGTTAAAAHKMNRQYIGVEQMDYVEGLAVERLRNVIGTKSIQGSKGTSKLKHDKRGISKTVSWKGGGDFVYCELMKYNEAFMERIQSAKTSDELLQIWKTIAKDSFLNWYVNPKAPDEAVENFKALGKEEGGIEKQKRLLAELLDKNQLYVNLSEIDDVQFRVSDQDKVLNKAFYGETYNV